MIELLSDEVIPARTEIVLQDAHTSTLDQLLGLDKLFKWSVALVNHNQRFFEVCQILKEQFELLHIELREFATHVERQVLQRLEFPEDVVDSSVGVAGTA